MYSCPKTAELGVSDKWLIIRTAKGNIWLKSSATGSIGVFILLSDCYMSISISTSKNVSSFVTSKTANIGSHLCAKLMVMSHDMRLNMVILFIPNGR